ncbi:MAG: phytoene desaturase [Pseudomonadota bacterium]
MTVQDRKLASPTVIRPRPHAVVIGTGFGGLAAAIRLGARGYRVTVLEKQDVPGGRARVFEQDGYRFDAGPTIITLPHLLEDLWRVAGREMAEDVELRSLDPFYRFHFNDGETLTCSGDAERMRAEIARVSPGDVRGFERLISVTEPRYRVGFERYGNVPFNSVGSMIRALPSLLGIGAAYTVAQGTALYLKDPRLRLAFSYHPLLIGGNPYATTSVYLLILALERKFGVHFAMGGTGAVVEGLARLIEGQGNPIHYGTEVAEIQVKDGRTTGVRLTTGQTLPADIVVSNADAAWTWKHLVGRQHRRRWTDAKLDRARYSMGLFVWYFGTNRRWDEVQHHSLVLGPRYKGLLDDIFKRHVLAEDCSLYLYRPTATDPSLAPPGCDTFYALSPVPHLDSGTDWGAIAETYRQKIQDRLESTLLPGLGQAIATSRVVTPQYFHDALNSVKGSGFSLEPNLFQSAWFRPNIRAEDVEGLYLVGAGTHPGAGVPGVLTSAQILQEIVPDAASLC